MKKKMKTNQDGGSVTASDPAAAGKQLAADQKAGGARMGYSQKFGPGRMNGYDAGAKKTMDVMSHGGASKYMAEGPAQGARQKIEATVPASTREFRANRKRKFDAMNERLRINKDEARTNQAIQKQRDINSMQADVKDGTRPGFSNPSVNPIDGMKYSYGARLMKGGDAMINPASSDERNITRGADGYYTADAFPRNRRSARSREEFTGTYGRDRGNRETPNRQGSFDYAKSQYERNAQIKATQRNRMIDAFKTEVGIDVNRERAAAAQNIMSAAFNRGIGSVKNSTLKNPTGLKSYETKEIN
jgi:hypothetical protein